LKRFIVIAYPIIPWVISMEIQFIPANEQEEIKAKAEKIFTFITITIYKA
jgi:hypothetical protein